MSASASTRTPQVEDRLLRSDEASDLLGVSVRMIHRLVETRRLPKVRIGRAARFRLSDLQTLIEQGAE